MEPKEDLWWRRLWKRTWSSDALLGLFVSCLLAIVLSGAAYRGQAIAFWSVVVFAGIVVIGPIRRGAEHDKAFGIVNILASLATLIVAYLINAAQTKKEKVDVAIFDTAEIGAQKLLEYECRVSPDFRSSLPQRRKGYFLVEKLLFWATNSTDYWQTSLTARGQRRSNHPLPWQDGNEKFDSTFEFGDDSNGPGPYLVTAGAGVNQTTDARTWAASYVDDGCFYLYYKMPWAKGRTEPVVQGVSPQEYQPFALNRLTIQIGHAYDLQQHWSEIVDLEQTMRSPGDHSTDKARARRILADCNVLVHPFRWGWDWQTAVKHGGGRSPAETFNRLIPIKDARVPAYCYNIADRMNRSIYGTVGGVPIVPPIPRPDGAAPSEYEGVGQVGVTTAAVKIWDSTTVGAKLLHTCREHQVLALIDVRSRAAAWVRVRLTDGRVGFAQRKNVQVLTDVSRRMH